MWQVVFGAVSILAMIAWLILILLPRRPLLMTVLLYLGVGLLCLTYTIGITTILTGFVEPVGPVDSAASFLSIEGVRTLFASDGGITIGWIHYLAFDLFVGIWIAKDADAKGFSRFLQAPILLATFMAGPVGLFLWLIIRERRARRAARDLKA